MSNEAIVIIELAAIAAIAVGVWVIYWPAALIVAGALVLVGSQGLKPQPERDGE